MKLTVTAGGGRRTTLLLDDGPQRTYAELKAIVAERFELDP